MLMGHPIDKHLVASSIYLHRVASALESIDLRTVPTDRRESIKQLRADVLKMLRDIEITRVGADDLVERRRRYPTS